MIEVDVLEKLSKNDKGGSQYVSIGFYLEWGFFPCVVISYNTLSCFLVQLCADLELVWLPQPYMYCKYAIENFYLYIDFFFLIFFPALFQCIFYQWITVPKYLSS